MPKTITKNVHIVTRVRFKKLVIKKEMSFLAHLSTKCSW